MGIQKPAKIVCISCQLLKSPAYHALRAKSCQVLGIFWLKHQQEPRDLLGEKTENILFTYNEAEKDYAIGRQSFSHSLGELIEKGFIDILFQGTGIGGASTVYTLSQRWENWGKESFIKNVRIKRCSYKFPEGEANPCHPLHEENISANGPYPPEFNEELRSLIRQQDGNKCQICLQDEFILGERLSIHHIDYDKMNPEPSNLISLCNKCHAKTNRKRKYWIQYFRSAYLKKRGQA